MPTPLAGTLSEPASAWALNDAVLTAARRNKVLRGGTVHGWRVVAIDGTEVLRTSARCCPPGGSATIKTGASSTSTGRCWCRRWSGGSRRTRRSTGGGPGARVVYAEEALTWTQWKAGKPEPQQEYRILEVLTTLEPVQATARVIWAIARARWGGENEGMRELKTHSNA